MLAVRIIAVVLVGVVAMIGVAVAGYTLSEVLSWL